jgi:valyl-tRNA synthetase
MIGKLTRTTLKVGDAVAGGGAAHAILTDGSEVVIPLGGIVDLTKECAKVRTELEQLEKQLTSLSARLSNAGFTSRAPVNVVDAERRKEQEWIKRRDQLRDKVKSLCGG